MHPYGIRQLLDDLVGGAVEFAHGVAIDYVERAVFVASDEFVGEWAGEGREDDAGAGSQVLIIVVEDLVGGEIVRHFQRGAAGLEFYVAVAPVSYTGVERAVSGDGEDLVAKTRRQGTAPNCAKAAGSAAVGALVARGVEDGYLLLDVEGVVAEDPSVVGAVGTNGDIVDRPKGDVDDAVCVEQS